MLSIDRCKQILNRESKQYSYDEIKIIRDFLYTLANIEYQLLQTNKL